MMRFLLAAAAVLSILLTTGCVDVRYVGDVYPPTTHVRIFMNEKNIPADTYVEMGTATVSIDDEDAAFRSSNVLSDALREKAMEVGADAILIVSNERYKVGTRYNSSTSSSYTERERGKSHTRHGYHGSRTKYKSTTHGHEETFTSAGKYDVHRDEVRATFLKLKKYAY